MIKAQGLKKVFKTPAGDLNILNSIDLNIEAGEFVSIMGASGVGKSTLLHILGTLDRPSEGEVEINSQNVFEMDEKALTTFRNTTIGFVFQFHHLMPEFTALENVLMPALINGQIPRQEAEDKALALLKRLRLGSRTTHRPGELSGGEQQRVAVARALILNPKVVLADEPTGNLDTNTGEELFSLLRELNNDLGTTFLIATHNESLSAKCDRVVMMVDGQIKSS
jgi:lipoprotein-releasing system ATP-binding protein